MLYKHVIEIHGECHYSLVERFVSNYIHTFDLGSIETLLSVLSDYKVVSRRGTLIPISAVTVFIISFERKTRAYWDSLVYLKKNFNLPYKMASCQICRK